MTTKELKKLEKALELVKKADLLIEEVVKSSDKFKYDGNTNSLRNKIQCVIDILSDN